MFGPKIMTAGAWRAAFKNAQQTTRTAGFRQAFATGARGYQARAFNASGMSSMSKNEVMMRVGIGAAAAVGVVGVCTMGEAAADKAAMWPAYVSQRVSATYGYFAGGIAMTAASATMLFKTGALNGVMQRSPMVFAIGGAVVAMGSAYLTMSIDIHTNKPMKMASWLLMNLAFGAFLVPMGFAGGPLVFKAATYTGCVVGALSLVAMSARDDKFLWMGGPLAMGLMVVVVSSFGRMFLPAHFFVAHTVMENICMYGGTAVFSGMILYKSQAIVQKAKYQRDYDALNASIGIYTSTINLFISILNILQSRRK